MKMKHYRVDKVASEIAGKMVLDHGLYIEEKINSKGHTYYLMVEDYTPILDKKSSVRIRKDVALHRIENKIFVSEDE